MPVCALLIPSHFFISFVYILFILHGIFLVSLQLSYSSRCLSSLSLSCLCCCITCFPVLFLSPLPFVSYLVSACPLYIAVNLLSHHLRHIIHSCTGLLQINIFNVCFIVWTHYTFVYNKLHLATESKQKESYIFSAAVNCLPDPDRHKSL